VSEIESFSLLNNPTNTLTFSWQELININEGYVNTTRSYDKYYSTNDWDYENCLTVYTKYPIIDEDGYIREFTEKRCL